MEGLRIEWRHDALITDGFSEIAEAAQTHSSITILLIYKKELIKQDVFHWFYFIF